MGNRIHVLMEAHVKFPTRVNSIVRAHQVSPEINAKTIHVIQLISRPTVIMAIVKLIKILESQDVHASMDGKTKGNKNAIKNQTLNLLMSLPDLLMSLLNQLRSLLSLLRSLLNLLKSLLNQLRSPLNLQKSLLNLQKSQLSLQRSLRSQL